MAACSLRVEDAPVPRHDTSVENLAAASAKFAGILDSSAVVTDIEQCYNHSNTPWSPATPEQRPACVLFPSTTEDVSNIMKICSSHKIPVMAFSGGTGLQGTLTATRGGCCIDFGRMKHVLAVHEDDMDAVVQPGVGWQDLNKTLAPKGLFFPPDPSPEARIGGMIAMNCSGTNAYRYGPMREWVIGLTVVLADGTIVKTRHRPRKSSAGYDLTRLIVGSEGTLGVVTEAVLKLTAAPVNLHVGIATFADLHASVRMGLALIRAGLPIEALELLGDSCLKALNASGLSEKRWSVRPTLFLKFAGSEAAVNEQIAKSRRAADQHLAESFEVSNDPATMELWWSARKNVAKGLLSQKSQPSDIIVASDAAVPISRLGDLMAMSQGLLADCKLPGGIVGHLGDGNIHASVMCRKDEEQKGVEVIRQIEKFAIELEGTITGEHGVGMKLRDSLVNELGENAVNMMRQIKVALDPQCILNCDKVIRLP